MRRTLIFGGAAISMALPLLAQHSQAAGTDDVAAANAAFDAALSRRDLAAVEAAWLHAAHVIAVHPASRTPVVGWDAVRRSWEETFERFAELSVILEQPKVHVAGDAAWVVGVEAVRGRRRTDGVEVGFAALTTNLYERHEGRWLMVLHHASRAPQ